MRRAFTLLFVVVAVLVVVPGWSGEARLALLGTTPRMRVTRVMLDARRPRLRRVGALTYLGGVALASADPAFGGFSSLSIAQTRSGDRFTLLSDGGNIVRFTLDPDWHIHGLGFANLPGGPRTGWEKRDRDSESMAVDPTSGAILVGFESVNQIWRYAPGFARVEGWVAPRAMAKWSRGGGAESMARRADGSIVVIAEDPSKRKGKVPRAREGLVFARDPTERPIDGRPPRYRFTYVPSPRYYPSDATMLPDGRMLVLTRAFTLPYVFASRLELVEAGAIRPGAVVRGRTIATLADPLIHDNFEGITVTREGAATIVWLVSDDNQSLLQRSLLLKFRLDDMPKARRPD